MATRMYCRLTAKETIDPDNERGMKNMVALDKLIDCTTLDRWIGRKKRVDPNKWAGPGMMMKRLNWAGNRTPGERK